MPGRRLDPPKPGHAPVVDQIATSANSDPPLVNRGAAKHPPGHFLKSSGHEPAADFRVAWPAIDLAFSAIRGGRSHAPRKVLPPIHMQLIKLLDHEIRSAPVRSIPVTCERQAGRSRKNRLAKHITRVELLGQHLKDHPREGVSFINLPEV